MWGHKFRQASRRHKPLLVNMMRAGEKSGFGGFLKTKRIFGKEIGMRNDKSFDITYRYR
jgi:hypothetical protein